VTSYSGTVHFSSSDTASGVALPADSTLTNGQGTFTVRLAGAGTQTLTASDVANALSTTVSIGVTAAPTNRLALTTPVTATAGTGFSMTVTALDQYGNINQNYSGTVHFSSSDTSAGVLLPPNSSLSNGQGTFSATLVRAGTQTLTVSDAANALSTTGSIGVIAAPATHLALATVGAPSATAGTSVSFTVTALDQFGNTDTNYAGTVHFSSSDTSPGVALPANSRLTSGQGTFSATLDRAGSQTITGADTATSSITGRVTVTIRAASAASLSLNAPATATVNQAFSVKVTALDRFGNVANGYTGTVHFSSSDLLATQLGKLPADYTFTTGDAGVRSFSVTLMTAGSQTITVTDTVSGALSVTSPTITVGLM
jgi:S-adenosylmethionine hydrolase